MSTTIHALVHSLREELKQYGEMLALLEEQQECIVARRIEDLLRSAVSIQSQGDGLQETRQNRARLQAQLAAELGL